MKKLLFLILFFFSTLAHAQNRFCKDLVQSHTRDYTAFTSPTPAFLGWANMQFCLTRVTTADSTGFLLQAGNATLHPGNETSVIVITFKDKTTLTFANTGYRREFINNDLLTDRHWFIPTAVLTKTDMQTLMTENRSLYGR